MLPLSPGKNLVSVAREIPFAGSVFMNTLQAAAQKRIAFRSYVSHEVVERLSCTTFADLAKT
jgi:hypothetical protein